MPWTITKINNASGYIEAMNDVGESISFTVPKGEDRQKHFKAQTKQHDLTHAPKEPTKVRKLVDSLTSRKMLATIVAIETIVLILKARH
jgi:uncharacterized protein with von Willebrand factor type A (vWA) domain